MHWTDFQHWKMTLKIRILHSSVALPIIDHQKLGCIFVAQLKIQIFVWLWHRHHCWSFSRPALFGQFQFVDLPLVLVKLPEPCMFCLSSNCLIWKTTSCFNLSNDLALYNLKSLFHWNFSLFRLLLNEIKIVFREFNGCME